VSDAVLLIFDLENIPGGLYEFDWVDGLVVDPDLVVNVVAGATARAAHIRYAIAPRDALPHLHARTATVSINGFKPERMSNFHHDAVSALTPGEGHDAVGGRVDRGAARGGDVEASVHRPAARPEAAGPTPAVYRLAEGQAFGGEAHQVDGLQVVHQRRDAGFVRPGAVRRVLRIIGERLERAAGAAVIAPRPGQNPVEIDIRPAEQGLQSGEAGPRRALEL